MSGQPMDPVTGGRLPDTPPLPSGNDPLLLDTAKRLGWNWGAFLMPYLWLIGHGRLSLGMFLLVSAAIPIVGWVHVLVYPITAVLLGLSGHETAWRHRAFHSIDQLQEIERTWTLWGLFVAVFCFLGALFLLVYFAASLEEAMRFMEEAGI